MRVLLYLLPFWPNNTWLWKNNSSVRSGSRL